MVELSGQVLELLKVFYLGMCLEYDLVKEMALHLDNVKEKS